MRPSELQFGFRPIGNGNGNRGNAGNGRRPQGQAPRRPNAVGGFGQESPSVFNSVFTAVSDFVTTTVAPLLPASVRPTPRPAQRPPRPPPRPAPRPTRPPPRSPVQQQVVPALPLGPVSATFSNGVDGLFAASPGNVGGVNFCRRTC